jgi:hypothetical protein
MALPSSNVIKLPTPEERDRTKLRNALRETAVATGVAIHTVLEAEFRYMGVEGHCKKDGIVNYVISHQTLAKHLGYPRAAALEPHIETAEARFGKVEQIMRKASSGLGRPALHVMLPPEHACFVLELTKGRKAARVLADLRRAFLELYLAEGVTKDARLELNMNYVRALRQQRNDARHEAAQVKAALSAAQTEMKSLDAQVQQLICKLNEARAAQDAMKAAAKPRFIAGARVTGKYALPGFFSYKVNSKGFIKSRRRHGEAMMRELGVIDQSGVLTDIGRHYAIIRGGSIVYDQGLEGACHDTIAAEDVTF